MLQKIEKWTAWGEWFDLSERDQLLSERVCYYLSFEWTAQEKQNIAEEVWKVRSIRARKRYSESFFNPGVACQRWRRSYTLAVPSGSNKPASDSRALLLICGAPPSYVTGTVRRRQFGST